MAQEVSLTILKTSRGPSFIHKTNCLWSWTDEPLKSFCNANNRHSAKSYISLPYYISLGIVLVRSFLFLLHVLPVLSIIELTLNVRFTFTIKNTASCAVSAAPSVCGFLTTYCAGSDDLQQVTNDSGEWTCLTWVEVTSPYEGTAQVLPPTAPSLFLCLQLSIYGACLAWLTNSTTRENITKLLIS